jgi:cytochrome b6-f complex iron-sulfur subunit
LGVAFVIVLILLATATSVVLLANRARSGSTGAVSRETRRRDKTAVTVGAPAASELSASTEIEAAGRERADETRATLGGGLARRRRGEVVEYEPVDEEELGVNRRQFLNRALLLSVGFGLAGFAPAMLAFLWPFRATGFGGVFTIGNVDDIKAKIDALPGNFYAPQARTYMVRYPNTNKAALDKAKKIYKPAVYNGMEQYGLVALYQRCVHLGCRVPFCPTSQWFECPCHGSKYNRVGEKKAGPAPRGLDRFALQVTDNVVKVDTGTIYNGPAIGTNTTGQEAEGPLCV